MKDNSIHIALCFDDQMMKYALVFIESLIHFNPNTDFSFHIISPDESGLEKSEFSALLHRSSHKFKFYSLSDEMLGKLPIPKDNRFTKAIYYRLFLTELVDKSIDRLLYFDVDIIFNGKIDELWQIDINDYALAAVYDTFRMKYGYLEIRKLYSLPNDIYFNSGVMLINLAYWRENVKINDVINYISEKCDELYLPDQDAINYFLAPKIKAIPPKWNCFTGIVVANQSDYLDYYSISELEEAKNNPVVIHFSFKRQDDRNCFHPGRKQFYKFLQKSSYKKYFAQLKFQEKIRHFLFSIPDPKRTTYFLELDIPEYKKWLYVFIPDYFWDLWRKKRNSN